MILPFTQKFPDGTRTYFAEKIISSNTTKKESDFLNFYIKKPDYYSRLIFLDTKGINEGKYLPKIHTIREDLKNRWNIGNKIHAVYNNCSKNQFQFTPTFKCTGIQKIEITFLKDLFAYIRIDGRYLLNKELYQLATNDGFCCLEDFVNWFGGSFEGKIIHWTDFRY